MICIINLDEKNKLHGVLNISIENTEIERFFPLNEQIVQDALLIACNYIKENLDRKQFVVHYYEK